MPRGTFLVTAVFAAVALLSAGVGYLAYSYEAEAIHEHRYQELAILGRTNAGHIAAWMDERLADVGVTATSPFLTSAVTRWLATRDPGLGGQIGSHLSRIASAYRYEGALLLALDGEPLITTGTPHAELTPETRELLERVLALGAPAMEESVVEAPELHVHVDVAALLVGTDGRPLALLLLRSDPAVTLYPRLLAWPEVGASAEVLLVRRRGDRVTFLNAPRLAGETPPRSFPLAREDVPVVRAALGQVGRYEGPDYRGVSVLADVRGVSGSEWFMVTKVDAADVLAEARYRGLVTLLAVVLVTLLVGGSLSLLLLRGERHRRHEVGSMEAERDTMRRHYERIFSLARDIFILADPDGRILDANRAAEAAYGYSREELLAMTTRDLRAPEARASFESDVAATRLPGGATLQTVHQRRDGSRFPVEIASRWVSLEGRTFRQSVVRDISDRVRAEAELQWQLDELQRWNSVALGREERILELKAEINDLLQAEGRPPRYASSGDTPESADA